MSKEVYLARLTRLAAADVDPTLDALDLEYLLQTTRIVDAFGRSYKDADWEPTYDINRAIQLGWEQKAGKASSRFNFSSDVNSFQREQVYKHCLEMANRYKAKGMTNIQVFDETDIDPVIANL